MNNPTVTVNLTEEEKSLLEEIPEQRHRTLMMEISSH